jgi:hypothetical protein
MELCPGPSHFRPEMLIIATIISDSPSVKPDKVIHSGRKKSRKQGWTTTRTKQTDCADSSTGKTRVATEDKDRLPRWTVVRAPYRLDTGGKHSDGTRQVEKANGKACDKDEKGKDERSGNEYRSVGENHRHQHDQDRD